MRFDVYVVELAAAVMQCLACGSETGEGIFTAGASRALPTSGGQSPGGTTSAGTSSGGSPIGEGGASTGGVIGNVATGGASANSGVTASANGGSSSGGRPVTASDGGPQSSCGSSLSGQQCTAGASCIHVAPDGCSAVNCVCNSGKWGCATSVLSCGKCPAAQEARCGDPCNVVARGCLCQCGGPNFTSCSCSAGAWQCLGC
jgi:hypothetical protein